MEKQSLFYIDKIAQEGILRCRISGREETQRLIEFLHKAIFGDRNILLCKRIIYVIIAITDSLQRRLYFLLGGFFYVWDSFAFSFPLQDRKSVV